MHLILNQQNETLFGIFLTIFLSYRSGSTPPPPPHIREEVRKTKKSKKVEKEKPAKIEEPKEKYKIPKRKNVSPKRPKEENSRSSRERSIPNRVPPPHIREENRGPGGPPMPPRGGPGPRGGGMPTGGPSPWQNNARFEFMIIYFKILVVFSSNM